QHRDTLGAAHRLGVEHELAVVGKAALGRRGAGGRDGGGRETNREGDGKRTLTQPPATGPGRRRGLHGLSVLQGWEKNNDRRVWTHGTRGQRDQSGPPPGVK